MGSVQPADADPVSAMPSALQILQVQTYQEAHQLAELDLALLNDVQGGLPAVNLELYQHFLGLYPNMHRLPMSEQHKIVISGLTMNDLQLLMTQSQHYLANSLWSTLRLQITPTNRAVAISSPMYDRLGAIGTNCFMENFRKDVGAQAMFVRDGNIDRILIGSIAFFQTQQLLSIAGQLPILLPVNVATRDQGLGSTNAKTDPALKIPRPPNAFIIYRKEHHASTVAKYPGIDNNGISKILGRQWQEESVEVRNDFKARAEQKKLEHLRKYPGYTYKPRKPSQVKRRISKKKAGQAVNIEVKAGQSLASQYHEMPQETGVLYGRLGKKRVATLPLSENTEKGIEAHNQGMEKCSALPGARMVQGMAQEFAPTAEYNAAMMSDLALLDLFIADPAPTSMDAFFQDPYAMAAAADTAEWDPSLY